jgi:hypothetical protein
VLLDIDDVLCLSNPYGGRTLLRALRRGDEVRVEYMLPRLFVPRSVAALRRVHDAMGGHLSYVLSSSWRRYFTRDELVRIFRGAGAHFVADLLRDDESWCTPIPDGDDARLRDIESWFRIHWRGEPVAVIDDTYSSDFLHVANTAVGNAFFGRVTLCDESVGLQDEHVDEIVAALRRAA